MDLSDPNRILFSMKVPQNAGQEGKVSVLKIEQTQTSLFLGGTNIRPSH